MSNRLIVTIARGGGCGGGVIIGHKYGMLMSVLSERQVSESERKRAVTTRESNEICP